MTNNTKLNFDIHSNVVFKLGEDLITNSYQALVELIKNCYDADAFFAKIQISTHEYINPASVFNKSQGYIQIDDNGEGMSYDDIKNKWLVIAYSSKQNQKTLGTLTRQGRTPLGDKGLGRLGVQKLGTNVELITKSKNDGQEYTVYFSWNDFQNNDTLSKIDISCTKTNCLSSPGTRLIISGLKNIPFWESSDCKDKLQEEFAEIISPFKEISNFMVSLNINGEIIDLLEISESIRNYSILRFWIEFDGIYLKVKSKIKSDFLIPQKIDEKRKFYDFIQSGNCEDFSNCVLNHPGAKDLNLIQSKDSEWLWEASINIKLDELDKLSLINGEIANPGIFSGEIDSYNMNILKADSTYDKKGALKNIAKKHTGIKVFRDGFGIKVHADWLGLSAQQTSGTSWYGLRPSNVIGYIAISARNNACLQETTDREGFIDNEFYNNFYKILERFVTFSQDLSEHVRRRWNEYKHNVFVYDSNIEQAQTPLEITTTIVEKIATVSKKMDHLAVISDSLGRNQEQLKNIIDETENSLLFDNKAVQNIKDLEKLINEAKETLSEAATSAKIVDETRNALALLEEKINRLNEQLDAAISTVSLGITAEALTHEWLQITSNILYKTQLVRDVLMEKNIHDTTLTSYFTYIKGTLSSIRKQISYLDPSQRYMREQKESLDVLTFVNKWIESKVGRGICIKIKANKAIKLHINPGKLYQILDNLYLNSEYWLNEAMRLKKIPIKEISIEIDYPCIRFFDNGLGVDNSISHSLFEPFVSLKENGRGRGLGLYIVQQLLDAEGASIQLSTRLNALGRRYIFEIIFTDGVAK